MAVETAWIAIVVNAMWSEEMPPAVPGDTTASREPPPEKTVHSADLFEGRRIVWIEHEGARYRLLITSRGKLILQK